jgi:hypothetical protein
MRRVRGRGENNECARKVNIVAIELNVVSILKIVYVLLKKKSWHVIRIQIQVNSSILSPAFESFIGQEVLKIGTAACPPYHLAVVVGGLSAEQNLKMVKLASCR